MTSYLDLQNSLNSLGKLLDFKPDFGIVLGTGLGSLANKIDVVDAIPYEKINGFPHATVESHSGQLSWGWFAGQKVVAMEGRFHAYEGYHVDQITLPIRVMKASGVQTLIVSNAAGGLNPNYEKGDIVLIEDHINLMGINPLIGANDERLGDRFPDMVEPYCLDLLKRAEGAALSRGIKTQRGVYAAVLGPNLETRAEYRYLRTIGADLVGMSTVPEVLVAVHSKMQVLGLSCVTDRCLPDALEPVDIDAIIATAQQSEPLMCQIVEDALASAPRGDDTPKS